MAALLIMILAFAGYIIMYQLYGKFINRCKPLPLVVVP
jgi:carbon starvation protein CstA